MKLWRIWQTVNASSADTYDEAVVAAETEAAARQTHPDGNPTFTAPRFSKHGQWVATADLVKVELLGDAAPGTEAGVIVASYNAG